MMCITPQPPKPYAPLPEHPPDFKSDDSAVPSWMRYQVIQDRQRRRLMASKESERTHSVFTEAAAAQTKLGGA